MLPVANPKVIYKALLDGEAVLFSTEEEVYFGLNEVGARVWELLPPATNSLDELCAALAVQYLDADPAWLTRRPVGRVQTNTCAVNRATCACSRSTHSRGLRLASL